MPMQALEQFEKRIKRFEQIIERNIEKRVRLFEEQFEQKVEQPFRRIEQKIGENIEKRVRLIEEHFERKVELPFRRTGQKIGRNIETRIRRFEQKNGIRLDDEVRFIGSWIKKPFAVGSVTPSGKVLARNMARYVDPDCEGPVIELGPGTGPVTEALIEHGVHPSRLVLVEFNPVFCQLLRQRFPEATVIQGDAYRLARVACRLCAPRGRGDRLRPAADDQADAHAHAAAARGARAVGARGAVRAVHLRGGAADPEACRRQGRGLRADLAQRAARARVGLSAKLT